MKNRKAYHIQKTKSHIRKKKRILRDVWQVDAWEKAHLKIWKQPHRLNKQKVHCSCPMCTSKVSSLGWKHSEKQHLAQGWDSTPVDDSLIWKSQQEKDKVVYSTKTEYDEELNYDLEQIYREEEKDRLDAELVEDLE